MCFNDNLNNIGVIASRRSMPWNHHRRVRVGEDNPEKKFEVESCIFLLFSNPLFHTFSLFHPQKCTFT